MKILDLFSKNAEEKTYKKTSDIRELEIYSGMRVVVEDLDGHLLFIAKLQDPQGNVAKLHQYSDAEIFQDMDEEAFKETGPVSVKLRGYNDRERKAVFMEGSIVSEEKYTWQIKDLVITKIENERSYTRVNTDIDALIAMSDGNNAYEDTCKLLNISIGGANVASEQRYHKGDRFLLKAKLREDRPLTIMYCEVLRVLEKNRAGYEYGCRFLELTAATEEQIAENIELISEGF